jgi:hypothetical protein
MGWIGSVRCGKFWHDFVARTFALIAPVWAILHRISCSNQMVQNISKMYETHKIMSLGFNGVNWVSSLQKIPTRLRGTNFCTSSPRFEIRFVRQHNGPKCIQWAWNAPKHVFRVQWGGSDALLRKILTRLRGTNFCINCTYSAHCQPSFIRKQNNPKCSLIVRNAPKQKFRV